MAASSKADDNDESECCKSDDGNKAVRVREVDGRPLVQELLSDSRRNGVARVDSRTFVEEVVLDHRRDDTRNVYCRAAVEEVMLDDGDVDGLNVESGASIEELIVHGPDRSRSTGKCSVKDGDRAGKREMGGESGLCMADGRRDAIET